MAIRLLLLALLVALAAPAGAQDARALGSVTLDFIDETGQYEPIQLYTASHALLIGVSDYTAGWPDLPGVPDDIAQVKAALERHGFDVHILEDPSGSALRNAVNSFIAQYGRDPESRLIIYYAGHGHTRKLSWGGEMGYLIPADCPRPDRDVGGFSQLAIDMEQVEVWAKRIESKHALFLFDSCFSGSIFALSRAVPASISLKTTMPIRQFITSGSANQEVPDKSDFRREFVRALDGDGDTNGDGYVTGSELGEYLYDRVTNYSSGAQTPQYGKIRNPMLDRGDFVFSLGKAPTQGVAPAVPSATPFDPSAYLENAGRERERLTAQAREAWNAMREIEDSSLSASQKANAYKAYLDSYGSTDYQLAQARERHQFWLNWTPPTPTPTPSPTPKPVEPGATKTLDLGGGVSMRLVWIPSGDGMAGFWMGETEVTQAQWKAVMENNPSSFKGEDLPVETVSWHDAVEFSEKVSSRTGTKVELPTSEQWEYACRAGTTTTYYFGDDESRLGEYAWYNGNSGGETHPVGRKKPNAWGLYDMHGNVWEWTSTSSGSNRVFRGGSWLNSASLCRSGGSGASDPGGRGRSGGFRLSCLPGK